MTKSIYVQSFINPDKNYSFFLPYPKSAVPPSFPIFHMNKIKQLTTRYQQLPKFDNFNFTRMRNSYQKLQLPPNYAHLLLQSEIQVKLARQPIQNNLCKLLELYSIGFQYYESLGSYKFQYFQLRMKEVFEQQQAENAKKRIQLTLLRQSQDKHNQLPLLSPEQTKLIDQKCREQQRLVHLKEMEEKTSVKSTSQEIKTLLLSGDYKAIEHYTKIKFELDMQQKILQQKLQQRHRRSIKSQSKNSLLKLNSTKTSLLSQSSKKGELLQEIKQNIFDKIINQNEDDGDTLYVDVNKQNEHFEDNHTKKSTFLFIKQSV